MGRELALTAMWLSAALLAIGMIVGVSAYHDYTYRAGGYCERPIGQGWIKCDLLQPGLIR